MLLSPLIILPSILTLASAKGSTAATANKSSIRAGHFTQTLDHFDHTTNLTFQQRYWYSLADYVLNSARSHRAAPSAIFLFDAGEFNAEERLAMLDTHLISNFTKSFGGIGIVLENRYYGKSYPNLTAFDGRPKTWGVDEMRWLTHRQSLEDTARFIRGGMHFDGVNQADVDQMPVIVYGGSLSGSRAAHLRIKYPELVFGAWASSAHILALPDFYTYYWTIARSDNVTAVQSLQAAWASIDAILAPEPAKGSVQPKRDRKKLAAFLTLAGVPNMTEPADWASLARDPLDGHQTAVWIDPDPTYPAYLNAIVHTEDKDLVSLREQAIYLGFKQGELNDEALQLIHWLRQNVVDGCMGQNDGSSADACFGRKVQEVWLTPDPELNEGKAFVFQQCTEYGWYRTAPPASLPASLAGPKVLSSLIDLRYSRAECDDPAFFPKGKHFEMPKEPDGRFFNGLGNFTIRKSRLGWVDGENDPWRSLSVHSEYLAHGGDRSNTLDEPFILTPGAGHHWDMFNTPPNSTVKKPSAIEATQKMMLEATAHWLSQWLGRRSEMSRDGPPTGLFV